MNVVKALLSSKKAVMTMASIVAVIAVRFFGLSEAEATKLTESIVMIVGLYVGSQGVADLGRGVGKGLAAKSEP